VRSREKRGTKRRSGIPAWGRGWGKKRNHYYPMTQKIKKVIVKFRWVGNQMLENTKRRVGRKPRKNDINLYNMADICFDFVIGLAPE